MTRTLAAPPSAASPAADPAAGRVVAPTRPRLAASREAAALALGIAAVLVAGKATLLPPTFETALESARWLLRLAIVSAADLRFAALSGVALALVLAILRRVGMPRWPAHAAASLVAVYGVAGVAMFKLMMVPLTLPLLSFAGGPALLASSLKAVTTPAWILSLVAAAAAPWASHRRLSRPTSPRVDRFLRPMPLAAAVCLLAAHAAISETYIESRWTDPNRWERRIAQSAPEALVVSAYEAALRGNAYGLAFEPDRVDESDFRRSAPPPTVAAPSALPNLVLIVLESVGVEHLGLYGSPHQTTPALARLCAERGLVFENCYAHAPSSPKGLVALTAGVYPGIDWKLITRDAPGFSVPTLAESVRDLGYRSCAAHSGYWSWKNRDRYLSDTGMDSVVDASTLGGAKVNSWGVSDDELFRAGLEWIDAEPGRPFHLLLWTIETHHPYIAGEAPRDFGVDDAELARYLNAVANADARIARFVEELERRGLAENTWIVVTGDHGEAFGRHGQRMHSFGVYEENVHVPLIVLAPRSAKLSGRRASVCQQIDLAPTLLARAGRAAPSEWQGRDLLADSSDRRAYFFSTGNEVLLGLRDGRWKYHYAVQGGREELYDLETDPGETRNLAASHPGRTAAYRARVGGLVTFQRGFLAEHGAP